MHDRGKNVQLCWHCRVCVTWGAHWQTCTLWVCNLYPYDCETVVCFHFLLDLTNSVTPFLLFLLYASNYIVECLIVGWGCDMEKGGSVGIGLYNIPNARGQAPIQSSNRVFNLSKSDGMRVYHAFTFLIWSPGPCQPFAGKNSFETWLWSLRSLHCPSSKLEHFEFAFLEVAVPVISSTITVVV
jgi:hypothetical protein